MKTSVIIPHYPATGEHNILLRECTNSLVGADEILIVVNQGTGFANAVNQGLKVASGDYLIVLNNDMKLEHGSLKDLCNPDAVMVPAVNRMLQEFWGSCFSIPRWVYEEIGELDEQFQIGYFEDDDYVMRLRKAKIPMKYNQGVNFITKGNQTMKLFGSTDPFNQNRARFIKKWGVASAEIKKYNHEGTLCE